MLIRPIPTPHRPSFAAWNECGALIADEDGNTWLGGVEQVRLARDISSIAISTSAAFGAARFVGGRLVIWSTGDLAVRELSASSLDAAFVSRGSEEYLAALFRHELVLFSPSGEVVARQPLGGLAASSLVAVAAGRALVVLGHEFAESRDTLALYETSELPISHEVVGRRFQFSEGLVDSSCTLAIGSCGPDQVVVFRDPRDAEDPLEPGEHAIVPREWGFRGFYVATRDGHTLQRLDADLEVPSGSPIVGTESYIAARIDDRIAVLSRVDGSREDLDLRWLGPAGSSAAIGVDANGVMQLIELEKRTPR
jgi:hypothetical protein